MNAERLRRIEELYNAVREAPAKERKALLAQADPELRREVESLLSEPTGDQLLGHPPILNLPQLFETLTVSELGPGALLGPYRIESKIGEGGMGQVFRATDTRLGRAVAIKTTPEQLNARFQREARAIASLNHPNICTLYDIGPNYLVMELLEGKTIAARLEDGPLPPTEAILYARQIAAALEAAHDKGIIHRDLKPGNIMLTASGAKVLDFGLVKLEGEDNLTTEGMVMGTPAYMAPEQRAARSTDARTDIYAFGWILYEMLTGERVPAQRKRISDRKLESVISRCLKEDPEQRWQSAAELRQELASISELGRRPVTTGASQRGTRRIKRKIKIVVGELENKTGDLVFDGMLRQGLSVQLEQSPFLTLVSDQQIRDILRLMNRPLDTSLSPAVAQEICERAGGSAVLDGSIGCIGAQYVLWLHARNCHNGDIIGQEQATAETKEQVLDALTRIAAQIRARLGESVATIREHSTPLEQATTTSLEALKAYSAGRKALMTRGLAAAIPHLRRAIALDPQFALAQADLGFFYWNMGQTDLAIEPTLKAYELRERVSDRERFFIEFLYDRQVTGNLHKELETIEAWVQAFPRDFQAWGVLGGWGTRGTGQYERGIRASEQCLRINPDITPAYVNLVDHNLGLGRFENAAAAMKRAATRKLELPHFLVSRYYLAFLDGDEAGMNREIDRARGNLEAEGWMLHHQALVFARRGQMRNARIRWRHTIELTQQAGEREKAAIYKSAAALCEAHLGNFDLAKENVRAALELANGRDVEYAAAFALALSGDTQGSEILTKDLAARFPEDTPVQFEYLPTLRALLALSGNKPLDAIEHLQRAVPYDLAMPGTAFFAKFGGLYPAYVRGRAYLQAGLAQEAAAQFQKVLSHRGIVLADPISALAHLELGRAFVASGNLTSAKHAYQEFFGIWKDADGDLPILKRAKAEHSELSVTIT